MEKVQDWMEITLLRTLHWFPFKFFGSPSSISQKVFKIQNFVLLDLST
jgi:hypothetical protein